MVIEGGREGQCAMLAATMRSRSVISALAVAVLAGCVRPIRTGALIDQYTRVDCIPVKMAISSPPTRSWDYTLKTRDGAMVHISGMQMPGGRIEAEYMPEGKAVVAANAGDYIYPADVRFDQTSERLYVKAKGIPAAFGGPQTWLFEYDLRQRRQTQRARIDPSVLPPECPADK